MIFHPGPIKFGIRAIIVLTMVAVGGVICHLLLIPPWVFCTMLPCVATALLVQRMQLAVLVVQVVLSMLAYQKPKSGVPCALLSTTISYAIYLRGDTASFAGSFIYSAMQWVNWGFTFPYVPAFTRLIFWLDMSSYYKKCRPPSARRTRMTTIRWIRASLPFVSSGASCAVRSTRWGALGRSTSSTRTA